MEQLLFSSTTLRMAAWKSSKASWGTSKSSSEWATKVPAGGKFEAINVFLLGEEFSIEEWKLVWRTLLA
jgi:hypothetical protein